MKGRLFLAVYAKLEAYGDLKKEFEGLVEGKWTEEKNLHATLYFFGKRYAQHELIAQLGTIDFSTEPSVLKGVGYFGRNKILYAQSLNPSLERLHKAIAALFGEAQHEFIPHITLMRVKKVPDSERLYENLDACRERELGQLEARVALVRSTLHPEGAQYRVVKWFS